MGQVLCQVTVTSHSLQEQRLSSHYTNEETGSPILNDLPRVTWLTSGRSGWDLLVSFLTVKLKPFARSPQPLKYGYSYLLSNFKAKIVYDAMSQCAVTWLVGKTWKSDISFRPIQPSFKMIYCTVTLQIPLLYCPLQYLPRNIRSSWHLTE